MKILVSTISYVNNTKTGSEIYTTFAKRLANDVLTKTPFDIFINTNRKDLFEEININNRIKIRDQHFKDHLTHVGRFNQLLKFSAIKDIPSEYDWVIYLDCDAGFTHSVVTEDIEKYLQQLDAEGIDMVALRTDFTYKEELENYYKCTFNETDFSFTNAKKNIFTEKFLFYGVQKEWMLAKLPSEHFFVVKNNNKLSKMADEFERLCYKFETQDTVYPITCDMEAFEIGVSALVAGYDIQPLGNYNEKMLFNIGYNYNNFERVKI